MEKNIKEEITGKLGITLAKLITEYLCKTVIQPILTCNKTYNIYMRFFVTALVR